MKPLIAVLSLFACVRVLAATVEPVQSPEQDEADVLAFWSPALMKRAEHAVGGPANPVDQVLTEGGDHFGFARVDQAHQGVLSSRAGILFYVSGDGTPQHCSATALKSAQGNLVLTAAHCVVENGALWKQKMLFVPAYDGAAAEGTRAPFGLWPVHYKYIPSLAAYESEEADLAIVSTFAQAGRSLEDVVGGASRACIFDRSTELPISQMWGYPGVSYSGGEMRRCLSRMDGVEGSGGVGTPNCATMSGSSGSAFRLHQDGDWAVAVVHGSGRSTRLRESTFQALYRLASGSGDTLPHCPMRGVKRVGQHAPPR